MFRNYLLTALRNLRKHRLISVINVAGLGIGLAGFLLIAYFIRFERGFDRRHPRANDIYLVVRENRGADYAERKAITGAPLAPLLLANVPQIEEAVRFTAFSGSLVRAGERRFVEDRFFFADPAALRVFSFPLVRGDAATALAEPFTVLLTERTARKYFGTEDPVGRVVQYVSGEVPRDFRVTGILRDPPDQSQLAFDFVASYASLPALAGEYFMTRHWDSKTWTYVRLAPGASAAEAGAQVAAVTARLVDKWSYVSVAHGLLPLRDVYFRGPGPAIGPTGSLALLDILTAVSAFLLLIAAFNFMNLSTSRAGARAKEIGLRKTSGARRGQLVTQFLGESVLQGLLGFAAALGLAPLSLPLFRSFVGRPVSLDYLGAPGFLALLALAAAGLGALAGIYPAFVLSGFRPVQVVRGKAEAGGGAAAGVRKALVVLQFAISIALISVVFTIVRQVRFLKGLDLGFRRDGVVHVPVRDRSIPARYELLKSRWLQQPGVLAVGAASMEPGVGSPNGIEVRLRGVDALPVAIVYADPGFTEVLGLRAAAGRTLSPTSPEDAERGILLNRSMARRLGFSPEAAVGERVEMFWRQGGREQPGYQGAVVGVLEDFRFRDLGSGDQAVFFKADSRRYTDLLVRVDPARQADALAGLERAWDELGFNQAFEWSFLAEDMLATLRPVDRFGAVSRAAAVLAVVIACLGLFGLAVYTIERRTKEIGVRKVLGATVPRLVAGIAREFLVLVLGANLIAWPAAWLLRSKLLERFALRAPFSPWLLLAPGALALAVAFLTVAGQSVRAAAANPVKSLRVE